MSENFERFFARECVVALRITYMNRVATGTGFFVAPHLILTCQHVVQNASSKIQVIWKNQEYAANILKLENGKLALSVDPDLSLLKLDNESISHPCVYLGTEIRADDNLYGFGYPKKISAQLAEGDSLRAQYVGPQGDGKLFTFSSNLIRSGFSGAPLLNSTTNRVCGLIVRERKVTLENDRTIRDVSGGTAISISAVLEQWENLREQNEDFHRKDSRWRELASKLHSSLFKQVLVRAQLDFSNAPDSPDIFFGRDKETEDLKRLIIEDKSRVVVVLGMGGVGKTAFVLRSVRQVIDDFPEEFDFMIFRELKGAPSLLSLLQELIEFLSAQQNSGLVKTEEQGINLLLSLLRDRRCLIVLDNFESLLSSGDLDDSYIDGREGYGFFLKRVGEVLHKSCILITSREKPLEVTLLQGHFPVHEIDLLGLSPSEGTNLIKSVSDVVASDEQWNVVVNHYAGNPLALPIVVAEVEKNSITKGNVDKFIELLGLGQLPFKSINDLLARQFDRLSEAEQELMYWISISREPVSPHTLARKLLSFESQQHLLSTLTSLQDRFLLQRIGSEKYAQQPVISEYINRRLLTEFCEEVKTNTVRLANKVAFIEATAKDYIRESQTRLLLLPLINKVENLFVTEKRLEEQLSEIIDFFRGSTTNGYIAGNILNLLIERQDNTYTAAESGSYKITRIDTSTDKELIPLNFSNVGIRQAYTQGKGLYNTDFSNSAFSECVFSESLGSIFSVAFSHDGLLVAAGDANGTIHVWRTRTFEKVITLDGDNSLTWALTFSRDSKILVSGHDDHMVRLWDLQTGNCLRELAGHTGAIRALSLSHSGQVLASASTDRHIRIWDFETSECIDTLSEHENAIWAIAFHPYDERVLASAGVGKQVRLWNKDAGRVWQQRVLYSHDQAVCSLAFSHDGCLLASSSHDKTIRVWNLREDSSHRTLGGSQGHRDWIWTIAFSYDNQFLASGSDDQTIKIWNIETERCVDTSVEHRHAVRGISFSPLDGKMMISGSYDQTVKIWNWSSDAQKLQCLKSWQGLASQLRAVSFSPTNNLLASCSGDRSVRVWSINFKEGTYEEKYKLEGHQDWVWCVAFSPNGKTLASASDDGLVKIWKVDGDEIKSPEEIDQSSRTRCIDFSPSARFLACGCNDGNLRIWKRSRTSWIRQRTIFAHSNWIWATAFSPDGSVLASASEDATIKLWDTKTWKALRSLEEHTNMVYSASFSPDGTLLASGSGDNTVRIWEVETGKCLQTLRGHSRWVWSVSFSPSGRMLASSSADHSVKLWDVTDIDDVYCRMTLDGSDSHENWVRCVKYSKDEQIIASGSYDEAIRLWDTRSGSCLAELRATGPYSGMNISGVRGLSQAEKNTLLSLGAVE